MCTLSRTPADGIKKQVGENFEICWPQMARMGSTKNGAGGGALQFCVSKL